MSTPAARLGLRDRVRRYRARLAAGIICLIVEVEEHELVQAFVDVGLLGPNAAPSAQELSEMVGALLRQFIADVTRIRRGEPSSGLLGAVIRQGAGNVGNSEG